jgi:hypothetical protein
MMRAIDPSPGRVFAVVAGVLAFLIIAGVALSGSGAFRGGHLKVKSTSTPQTGKPIQFAHKVSKKGLRGLGSTPGEILAAVLARMNSKAIADGTITGPPNGFQPTDDANVPVPGYFADGRWARLTVLATALTPEATTRPIWEANLVAGALRDAMHANGLPRLISSQVSVALPNGRIIKDVGGGVGDVAFDQTFSSAPSQSITSLIQSAATQLGLTVDSIKIVNAVQPAPAVVVTTSDTQQFADNPDAVLTALFGAPGTYEGEYLEVHDASGTVAFIQGSAFRTGVGQRWFNPAIFPGIRPGPPGPA